MQQISLRPLHSQGENCVIPFGGADRCPVQALLDWKRLCKNQDGEAHVRIILE
jgi:hypothetical protein